MIPLEHTDRSLIEGRYGYQHPEFNRAIFFVYGKRRYYDWGIERGPLVGDLYLLPGDDPEKPFRRFTHDWGDDIQGNTGDGSFHLDWNGRMSYSGGLDEARPKKMFRYAKRVMPASCWIFDGDWPRAHAGVLYHTHVRVWEPISEEEA